MPGDEITNTMVTEAPGAPDDSVVTPPPPRTGLSRRSKTIIRNNLLLAAMFLGGLAGLMLLHMRSGPQQAQAQLSREEMQVEAVIGKIGKTFSGSSDRSAKEIVDSFYFEARERQIPLEKLRGNPFVFTLPATAAPVETAPVVEAATRPAGENPEVRAQTDAMAAAHGLQLQTVLSGAHGATAMISNNLLGEGQTIAGWTISKISSREVVLTWKDQTYVLKMPE